MADESRLKIWETLFAKALLAIDSVREPAFRSGWSFGGGTVLMRRFRHRISKDVDLFVPDPQYVLRESGDAILERLASGDKILRTTFKELAVLDYRPTYDHCVDLVKRALKRFASR